MQRHWKSSNVRKDWKRPSTAPTKVFHYYRRWVINLDQELAKTVSVLVLCKTYALLNYFYCALVDSGRVEPIGIVLKTDRKGLGREVALKEIREMKKSMLQSRRSAGPSVCEYRERRAQEAAEKLDRLDLFRCQRVCRQMDLEQV